MKNFLDTTAGSTHSTNVAITTYMPPEHATAMLAICNRCQVAEAEVKRLTPDDAHARQCRTRDLEALILRAMDNATLRVAVAAVHPCFRTGKVRGHLLEHKDRYGIRKPPSRDKIREVLIKHGYMF